MSVTDGMGNPNRGHALAVDRVRHTYGQGQAAFEALRAMGMEVERPEGWSEHLSRSFN